MQALKLNKGPGLDNYNPRILKLMADVLSIPIAIIYLMKFGNWGITITVEGGCNHIT